MILIVPCFYPCLLLVGINRWAVLLKEGKHIVDISSVPLLANGVAVLLKEGKDHASPVVLIPIASAQMASILPLVPLAAG